MIPPHRCMFVEVKIVDEVHGSIPGYFESNRNNSIVDFPPGIISIDNSTHTLPVFNGLDRSYHIAKDFIIGSITPLDKIVDMPVVANTTVVNNNIEANQLYWTSEKIREEFKFSEIPISELEKLQLEDLLKKYSNILSMGDDDVGLATNIKHSIELEVDRPVHVPVRRFQGPLAEEIENQCLELESSGIIRKSKLPFSAPVVPIRKKDGTLRLCVD